MVRNDWLGLQKATYNTHKQHVCAVKLTLPFVPVTWMILRWSSSCTFETHTRTSDKTKVLKVSQETTTLVERCHRLWQTCTDLLWGRLVPGSLSWPGVAAEGGSALAEPAPERWHWFVVCSECKWHPAAKARSKRFPTYMLTMGLTMQATFSLNRLRRASTATCIDSQI